MGHIHAALMAEYAKDAAETDKPSLHSAGFLLDGCQ